MGPFEKIGRRMSEMPPVFRKSATAGPNPPIRRRIVDRSMLEFHIEQQDYFGTLATVISLSRQTKQEIPESVIDDLMYLQRNYVIAKLK